MSDFLRPTYVEIRKSEDKRGCSFGISFENMLQPTEVFISKSHKNVIRGMHFQVKPNTQKKLIYVIEGSILGVVIDMRCDNMSECEISRFSMNENDSRALYIPEGCAWGFKAEAAKNTILYAIQGNYDKKCERGIKYDSFGFDWEIKPEDKIIINERDLEYPDLSDYIF